MPEHERPSWHLCDACKAPYTDSNPLVWFKVKGTKKALWRIHESCESALKETLREGVEIERA